MKKILLLSFALLFVASMLNAQTTAMNFNRPDCNGNQRHLFADLDSGKAVILEFFMQSCGACITAGSKLETMKSALLAQYPGKIKSYAIGYSNYYSSASIASWVSTNSFTSIPMDSGAAQVAYYGGMGMPTIVILGGGTAHTLLHAPYVGFLTSDTTTMASSIRTFLNSTGIQNTNADLFSFSVFPNPSDEKLNVTLEIKSPGSLKLELLNIVGQKVAEIVELGSQVGTVKRSFSVVDFPSGIYFLQGELNGQTFLEKVTVQH